MGNTNIFTAHLSYSPEDNKVTGLQISLGGDINGNVDEGIQGRNESFDQLGRVAASRKRM